MKKIMKNPILTFILGAILFSSATVLASQILARDIEYTRDGVRTNVESALNDLYDKSQRNRILIGSITKDVTEKDFDCTEYDGWNQFTTDDFAIVITGLYGNGNVNQSYFTADENSFKYNNENGILHVQNWHGISGRTDLRYAANIYLYL